MNAKSLKSLTTLVSISLALQAGVGVFAGWLGYLFDQDQIAGVFDSSSDGGALALVGGVGLLLLGLWAVNVTVFCLWMYRASSNLRAFGRTGLEYTPGWAVGWWFVPFANLVKPYRAMSEIVLASDPDVSVDSTYGSSWMAGVLPGLVPLWWSFWIGSLIVERLDSRLETFNLPITVVSVLLNALAAGACILVVREVAERQAALGAKVELTSKIGHVPERPEA